MAVKLKGPENHGGFSHQGVSYAPDENGHIDVPHEVLDEAFSHGFSLADQPGDESGEDGKGGKKKKSA